MEYLDIAKDFAERIWPYKEKLKIEDIMLFGSVAYGKKNPSDLDLLILHYNEKLERFQDIANSNIEDVKKLIKLSHILEKEVNLLGILSGTMTEKLIFKNKFNVKYMDVKFFTDETYKNEWLGKNKKISKKSNLFPNETFIETIFREGKLYNQKTCEYDILLLQRYNPKQF